MRKSENAAWLLGSTTHPNVVALHQKLYLGNPIGSLPDGTPLFALDGGEDDQPIRMLRWFKDGLVIDRINHDVSSEQLRLMAASIEVK